jgi:hypothetical protein
LERVGAVKAVGITSFLFAIAAEKNDRDFP